MDLPIYVNIYSATQSAEEKKVLRTEAQTLAFPLSDADLESVRIVEAKFDQEENMSGLAAPQIGIDKKIIVLAAPEDPELKKFRPDFTQTMTKTIWINAAYTGIGTEKHIDYEGCFSVEGVAGDVKRFKRIKYTAYTPDGKFVEGEAEGFLARIIQHEIDHTMGILYIDYLEPAEILPIEVFRQRRREKAENKT